MLTNLLTNTIHYIKHFDKKQIPNCLTVLRFVLAFISAILLILNLCVQSPTIYKISSLNSGLNTIELVLVINFGIAIFTDFLDGYLSRKWDATSDFGKIYDPVADKAIIIGFFLFFWYQDLMFRLIPIFLIARDVASDYIRIKRYKKNIVVPANKLAKFKTATQMMCVFIIMLLFNAPGSYHASWWISTLITLVPLILAYTSFVQYMRNLN